MTCIQCGAPTTLGEGYALPYLTRTAEGTIQNLYACSKPCRAAWLDARQQTPADQGADPERDATAAILLFSLEET